MADKPNPLVDLLLGARSAIPENKEHNISLANILRGGLGSAAGWMDWRNKLSPDDYAPQDTLAPLGLGLMGSAPAGALAANSLRRSPHSPDVWRGAHPRTTVEGRTVGERPTGAATAYGDDVFVSPHIHGGEYDEAVAKLGSRTIDRMANEGRLIDGFTTSAGRFVDRGEAAGLADAAYGALPPPTWKGAPIRDYSAWLESNRLQERIYGAWEKAKAAGNDVAAKNLQQQYRDLTARLDADNATAYNRPMRLDEKIK